jgi:hypothetical protein
MGRSSTASDFSNRPGLCVDRGAIVLITRPRGGDISLWYRRRRRRPRPRLPCRSRAKAGPRKKRQIRRRGRGRERGRSFCSLAEARAPISAKDSCRVGDRRSGSWAAGCSFGPARGPSTNVGLPETTSGAALFLHLKSEFPDVASYKIHGEPLIPRIGGALGPEPRFRSAHSLVREVLPPGPRGLSGPRSEGRSWRAKAGPRKAYGCRLKVSGRGLKESVPGLRAVGRDWRLMLVRGVGSPAAQGHRGTAGRVKAMQKNVICEPSRIPGGNLRAVCCRAAAAHRASGLAGPWTSGFGLWTSFAAPGGS